MEKNVNIYCGNTLLTGFDSLLLNLQQSSKDVFSNNILIVPDKFSMNAERYIFDALNINSTFNIDVLTFTRLIKRLCENQLKGKNILNKQSGILLVTRLLIENQSNLSHLKKVNNSPSVAQEIYETILQLKASGISPEELLTNSENLNFKYKLNDIKLIYNCYQQQLNQTTSLDSADVLEILAEQLKNNDVIKNSNIFIAMFDSFSYKQLKCIKSLILNAKSFNISLSANTLQNNKHIYINETLNDIMLLLRQNGINYKIHNVIKNDATDFTLVAQNLFGNINQSYNSQKNINLIEAENVEAEVDFVARKIKSLVLTNQFCFDDINICCASLDSYKPLLKAKLNYYGLPYYVDNTMLLSEHFLGKTIINLFNIINTNFDKDYVLNYIKSPLFEKDENMFFNYENYVQKYGINYSLFFNKIQENELENFRLSFIENLENFDKNIKKCQKTSEFF